MEDLDALVRRVDEDRWLSSRFAEAPARGRLIALYALVHEVFRTAEVVSDDLLGSIRLQFWKDGVEGIYAGAASPTHPALRHFAEAVAQASLPRRLVDELIECRSSDFESAPFATWADLEAYVDASAGGVARLGAFCCEPGFRPTEDQSLALRAAGRAWGYVGLVRAMAYWTARGRTFFPKALLDHVGLDLAEMFQSGPTHRHWSAAHAVLDRGEGALKEARRLVRTLPQSVFPAVSYVALTEDYLKMLRRWGLSEAGAVHRPSMFARQLRLVGATARGAL